jgi:hypothetical protein
VAAGGLLLSGGLDALFGFAGRSAGRSGCLGLFGAASGGLLVASGGLLLSDGLDALFGFAGRSAGRSVGRLGDCAAFGGAGLLLG